MTKSWYYYFLSDLLSMKHRTTYCGQPGRENDKLVPNVVTIKPNDISTYQQMPIFTIAGLSRVHRPAARSVGEPKKPRCPHERVRSCRQKGQSILFYRRKNFHEVGINNHREEFGNPRRKNLLIQIRSIVEEIYERESAVERRRADGFSQSVRIVISKGGIRRRACVGIHTFGVSDTSQQRYRAGVYLYRSRIEYAYREL